MTWTDHHNGHSHERHAGQDIPSFNECSIYLGVEKCGIAGGGISQVGGAADGKHEQADGLGCQTDLLSWHCQHTC